MRADRPAITAQHEQAFLAHVFESAPEAIVIVDNGGWLQHANSEFTRLFGYSLDEARGRSIDELLAPDELRDEARSITGRVAKGERITLETVRRRNDGTLVHVSIIGAPVVVTDGQIGVYGIYRDVSDRKRAEAERQAVEKRYRDLVEHGLGLICTHDLDGVLLSINRAAAQQLGYAPRELIGKRIAQLLAPSVRHLFRGYLARVRAEGHDSGMMRVVTKTGEERIWVYRNALHDEPGTRPYVLGHAQDITEHKRAEEALRRSEANYRDLVENASYGIYRSSAEGKFLAVNPALVKMLGYASAEELLAVDLAREVYADSDDRARLVAAAQDAEPGTGVEVEWKQKEGTLITVRLSGRPARNAQGELECFEMIAEDVTERLSLEAQLRQAQKMEAVGQLTGGIAHDFNNILTVIQGNADLLAEALPAEAGDLREELRDLRSAAQRGAELVRKLLRVSRQEQLQLRALDLGELVSDLSVMLRRVLPENIDVRVFVDEPVGTIRADTGAVEQILLNLATNARDAMPDGGLLHIATRRAWLDEEHRAAHGWGDPGQYVCLSVSDTGVGMDEQTRGRIFEPFFTTKPAEVGTGLGMAMIYGLVKQHGGFVDVYSELGQGTAVKIYFPVAREGRATPVPTPLPTELCGGTETILVVEDEFELRRAAARILEKFGYTVLLAGDGEQALELFRGHESAIDLILTDVVMPRMGGRELYAAAQQTGRNVKFLFTSGYTARDVCERITLDPRLPFLHKPWTLTELVVRVREVLDQDANT